MKTYNITLLPGDGVGPEVIAAAREGLESIADTYDHAFNFQTHPIGGAGIDAIGVPLPEATLRACRAADAVLLGAVGGPKWDKSPKRPEKGLLDLRKALGLYANVRPVYVHASLADRTPLKEEVVSGVDLVVFRELLGGSYYGEKKREGDTASDICIYTRAEIERVSKLAFETARRRRGKVTSVDKANVLEVTELWRKVVTRIHKKEAGYAGIELEHILVDNCAMQLIRNPRQFDVVVTTNMFGDILSDEASVLTGSLGMLPSATIGGTVGLYEPIHGSAPDIAGQDKANPMAALLSTALMLRLSFHQEEAAQAIEDAVDAALSEGYRTFDIAQPECRLVGCKEMGRIVREKLASE